MLERAEDGMLFENVDIGDDFLYAGVSEYEEEDYSYFDEQEEEYQYEKEEQYDREDKYYSLTDKQKVFDDVKETIQEMEDNQAPEEIVDEATKHIHTIEENLRKFVQEQIDIEKQQLELERKLEDDLNSDDADIAEQAKEERKFLEEENRRLRYELQQEMKEKERLMYATVLAEKRLIDRANHLFKSVGMSAYLAVQTPLRKLYELSLNHERKYMEKDLERAKKKYEKEEHRIIKKASKRHKKRKSHRWMKKNTLPEKISYTPYEMYRLTVLKSNVDYHEKQLSNKLRQLQQLHDKVEYQKEYIKDNFKGFLGRKTENEKSKIKRETVQEIKNSIEKKRKETDREKYDYRDARSVVKAEKNNPQPERMPKWMRGQLNSQQEYVYRHYKKKCPDMFLSARDVAYIPAQKLLYTLELNSHLPKGQQDIDKIARLSMKDLMEIKENLIDIPDKHLSGVIDVKVNSNKGISVEDALKQLEKKDIRSKDTEDIYEFDGYTTGKKLIYKRFMMEHPKLKLSPQLLKDVPVKTMRPVMQILSKTAPKQRNEQYVKDILAMSEKQIEEYATKLVSSKNRRRGQKELEETHEFEKNTEIKPSAKRNKNTKSNETISSVYRSIKYHMDFGEHIGFQVNGTKYKVQKADNEEKFYFSKQNSKGKYIPLKKKQVTEELAENLLQIRDYIADTQSDRSMSYGQWKRKNGYVDVAVNTMGDNKNDVQKRENNTQFGSIKEEPLEFVSEEEINLDDFGENTEPSSTLPGEDIKLGQIIEDAQVTLLTNSEKDELENTFGNVKYVKVKSLDEQMRDSINRAKIQLIDKRNYDILKNWTAEGNTLEFTNGDNKYVAETENSQFNIKTASGEVLSVKESMQVLSESRKQVMKSMSENGIFKKQDVEQDNRRVSEER